ncbi:MAG: DUF3775 domain-containing protein [Rhodanobacter sp.]
MNPSAAEPPMNASESVLSIPVDTVRFIIDKLREYDSRDMLAEPVEDPFPLESEDVDVLRDQENDYRNATVLQELHAVIDDLPEDQQVDLVALAWLGRDNCSATDWWSIREEAAEAHNARTADYLLGTSMAGDFLEEGLSALGWSDEHAAAERSPRPAGDTP